MGIQTKREEQFVIVTSDGKTFVSWSVRTSKSARATSLWSSGRRVRKPFVFRWRMNGSVGGIEEVLIESGRVKVLHSARFPECVPKGMFSSALTRSCSQQPVSMPAILPSGLGIEADRSFEALVWHRNFCERYLLVEAALLRPLYVQSFVRRKKSLAFPVQSKPKLTCSFGSIFLFFGASSSRD